jgi:prevent-host-death family protein
MAVTSSKAVSIPSTQVQRKFGEVVRRVYTGQEHFVVEKDGLPVMAIISMQDYEEFLKERERQQHLKSFAQAARAIGEAVEQTGLTEDEILEKLEEARQRVHERGYGAKSTE